ncbi:MAG: hypothetical protein Ct9H90mP2_03170 [Dehalococcoidia bacterium]|nr:MAG: hypothetical protein Ct9H90mP2_03170 [Dehalococcoidia bacterium]
MHPGIALPLNDEKLGKWYKKMAKNYGFKSAKLKVGLDQDSDLRRLEIMRNALSINNDDPILILIPMNTGHQNKQLEKFQKWKKGLH